MLGFSNLPTFREIHTQSPTFRVFCTKVVWNSLLYFGGNCYHGRGNCFNKYGNYYHGWGIAGGQTLLKGVSKKKKKHTTIGIRWWSPTQLLTDRSEAWLRQSGRDTMFSSVCGCMWKSMFCLGLISQKVKFGTVTTHPGRSFHSPSPLVTRSIFAPQGWPVRFKNR